MEVLRSKIISGQMNFLNSHTVVDQQLLQCILLPIDFLLSTRNKDHIELSRVKIE